MNADKILFHPSALGKIMTGTAKKWDVANSLTCKRELINIYREIKYNRYNTFTSKYTEKGIKMENDAITLLDKVMRMNGYDGPMLRKNAERLTNDWFTGEPDIILEDETIDTKCVWSLSNLPHIMTDEMDKAYEYQGYAYMDLTGAKRHTVAYCLVNATGQLVLREKEKVYYQMGMPDSEIPEYLKAKQNVEIDMIFDIQQFRKDNPGFEFDNESWEYDIPKQERVVTFTIEASEPAIQAIKDRITECREWMGANLFRN